MNIFVILSTEGDNMQKVLIIGCPGSGKSTFARKLHEQTQIPLYHLDNLFWNANRTTVEDSVFKARLQEVLAQDAWIIDGNFSSTMEWRMQGCDTIFFLDYPTDVCLAGVRERKGKKRSDIPWIEETDDEEFLQFIKDFSEKRRPQILELLNKYNDKKIYIFTSRNDANRYLCAKAYDLICDPWSSYRKPINKCIQDFCKYLPEKAKILDVGCGNGYPISKYLIDSGYQVTGIDISEKMISKAKELPGEFSVCDFMEYASDTKFDAIIAFDSLWHIPLELQKDIYNKMYDLLADGGYCLFTHGIRHSEVSGEMFEQLFYYSSLDIDELKTCLSDFIIIEEYHPYVEETTGDRELLMIIKK